ncbi:Flp pilus assembly protein CpaB [Primorskyibacter sp. S187A]|uniref:Flp pilus assembly protein CpaB n=1 Tax=Primorskyibacter sp. S187A TaxID=3415130 RepID=UPI003C7DE18B
MRVVFGLVLVLGLGLAGFAVYLVNGYVESYQMALEKERANQPKIVPTIPVYVAKQTLRYGDVLAEDQVIKMDWPKASVPEGAFTAENDTLFDGEDRFVLRTMEKHEPILAVKVTEPGQDAGVISRLGNGMRAFTIKVDVASGVSGFLRPGDRVDVYWTGSINENGSRRGVTKLIQRAVTIIAIDQQADRETQGANVARTITVRVDPLQVAALAQAQSTGALTLALVGNDDEGEIGQVAVDQTALLGLTREEIAPVIQEEKRECTIRTRKGAEVVVIPIPCTN